MTEDQNASCRAIFISYRRSDTEGEAGRLYDDLVRAYSDDSVFMDVTGIQPGLDFRKAIDANIAGCGVLLAVIGPNWATATDSGGNLRFANPNDYVRLEIASALAKQIPVIPVLVHNARMPTLEQLPDDLKDLRYRNSVELTHARWNSDVALLIGALKNYVLAAPSRPTEPVHATVPVQLPAPIAAPATPPRASRGPLYALGILALVILLGVGGYLASKHIGPSATPETASSSTASPQTAGATPAVASTPNASGPPQTRDLSPESAAKPTVSPKQSSTSTSSNAAFAPFLGEWKDSSEPARNNDELVSVSIVDSGGQLVVRAHGQCPNSSCDWGPKNATVTNTTVNGLEAVTDTWTLHNTDNETKRQRTVALSLHVTGSDLAVTIHNMWAEPGGQKTQGYLNRQFVKVQP